MKRINSMSLEELMAEGNKLIARVETLNNRKESIRLSCQSRSKLIPKNASIRKEFVKCKKSNCCYERHGPYYYAYWKEPGTKKLKKKYIGRNYIPDNKQIDQK